MPLAEGVAGREEGFAPKLSGSDPSGQKWEREKRTGTNSRRRAEGLVIDSRCQARAEPFECPPLALSTPSYRGEN